MHHILPKRQLSKFPDSLPAHKVTSEKEVCSKRRELAYIGSKFLSFRIDLFFQKGNKTILTELSSLKLYRLPLTELLNGAEHIDESINVNIQLLAIEVLYMT